MTQTRSLADLGLEVPGGREAAVTALAVDSRAVRPGTLFAALPSHQPGSRAHGADYIPAALAAGASAILTDAAGAVRAKVTLAQGGVPVIVMAHAAAALARAAALWSDAAPGTIVAVTGTNGKTSVASFTRQIWAALGHPAINIGTTGVEGAYAAPSAHTTPDAITLHAMLADAARAGVTHAAMEASSHGLDQRRMDGVRLTAAAFTNLTQDHLDYHGSMEAYFAAKAGLFARLLPAGGTAVVNLDDPRGTEVRAMAEARGIAVLAVGRALGCDLRILATRPDGQGQEVRIEWRGRTHQVRLALVGAFQAANAGVAAALVIAAGDDPDAVLAALPRLMGVRGRMQLSATRANGAAVYVDYCHTPDAVATALQALRPHVMGRLHIVLGAGGDRDRGKRLLMGQAAAAHADVVTVTDDNPRSEDPAAIRAAVLAGCPDATEVGDRAEAILRAVAALQPGDALLIAGKGHETGQTVGGVTYPFDDAEQARLAVAALDGGA